MAALQHQNFFTGASKVGCVHKSIVSAADYDDIEFVIHTLYWVKQLAEELLAYL